MNAVVSRCECGNPLENDHNADTGMCDWCDDAHHYAAMRRLYDDHCKVNVSNITGDVICVQCSVDWCDCLICSNPGGVA